MNEEKEAVNQAEEAQETAKTPEAEEKPADGGKLFTQEEVDRIIKDRLKRQKIKANEDQEADLKTRSEDLAKREADLNARETKLKCKEYLSDRGYPSDLLEILTLDDYEAFKKKADKVMQLDSARRRTAMPIAKPEDTRNTTDGFSRSAGKHKPKNYY